MGVIVKQVGGDVIPISFADTFNRASGRLGRNWIEGTYVFTPIVAPVAGTDISIGASTLDGLQCAIWASPSSGANPNTIWHGAAVPQTVYNSLYGADQFVQATFVQATGAGANEMQTGPSLFQNGDVDSCYYLEIAPASGTTRILRNLQSTLSVIGNLGVAPVNGNIYRMSLVNTGTQINFTVTINAGAPQTFSDATAQRITTGSPGLFCRGAGGPAPGRAEYRNFSCGKGA